MSDCLVVASNEMESFSVPKGTNFKLSITENFITKDLFSTQIDSAKVDRVSVFKVENQCGFKTGYAMIFGEKE